MGAFRRMSYILTSLVLVVVVALASTLLEWGMVGSIGTLSLAAVLSIYWVAARRGPLTPIDPEKKLRRARQSGRPVVLHFYSDYHLGSLLRRPFDSKVETTYRGRCEFIYISAFHRDADGMMANLKAHLGDWIFFDVSGKMVGSEPALTERRMQQFLETSP